MYSRSVPTSPLFFVAYNMYPFTRLHTRARAHCILLIILYCLQQFGIENHILKVQLHQLF
ncbi:hypothetical protein FWK35_00033821 [Aphis craccivora]|uniref:Uncharacterized protein n=1 Tax=Aphis craccivora TaxID=307492 RepID=A0A6G0YLB1_APHCR|nr:hypothetical protein FWK35_00033821 [Aphis craccivora]